MRHHLIALFALLSGLAALQAPAQANALEAAVHDAHSTARAGDNGAVQVSVVAMQSLQSAAKRPAPVFATFAGRVLHTLSAPVLVGSDRALE